MQRLRLVVRWMQGAKDLDGRQPRRALGVLDALWRDVDDYDLDTKLRRQLQLLLLQW